MTLYGLVLLSACSAEKDRISQIRDLVEVQNLEQAVSLAKLIPKNDAAWAEAQYILGRIEAARGDSELALAYYSSVPLDGSPFSVKCAHAAGEIEYHSCRLSAAVENVEYLVKQSPNDINLRGRLGSILSLSGQRFRAEPHFFEVLKTGKMQLKDLVWLTAPERHSDPDPYLAKCVHSDSRDPFVQLGMAVEEFQSQKHDAARTRVTELLKSHPNLSDAQALLGELTLDSDVQDFKAWYSALPSEVQSDPGIWYVKGLWARRVNEHRIAARCFWETIRQSPTHQRAMYQLGQLVTLIDSTTGAIFSERARQLKECGELMESSMIQRGRDSAKLKRMFSLLLDMGRDWEAWAWAKLACEKAGQKGFVAELLDSLSYVPASNPPRTRPEKNVALLKDFSDWPHFDTLKSETGSASPGHEHPSTKLSFHDQAADTGIDFTYFQSHSQDTKGVRMFESTGGGVGVIDFDLDGWPDLFFTQGVEWPVGADQPSSSGKYRDHFYRNHGSRFENVTNFCFPPDENGYGQGCSVGDFDNDGFPDIYVANIGANQLLRNNGDGTFSDSSRVSAIQGESWTTSCLIADLNADGNPDLYDVNYLQGDKIFSIECSASRCSVRNYQGAPDQVQLSRGDGTFEVVSNATPRLNSKGLGIVLFQLENESMPRLFVANDQVPNFYLRPISSEGKYVDEALSHGLAVNMYGQPTASMGVASGDVNHDGLIDLFVTNFEKEAKNLFLQTNQGFFEDAIFGSGLMAAGMPYVGWGTQFLDADNDTDLDLVVANGHIADFHEEGVEYQMPLQFFQGVGPARFVQLMGTQIDPLFERKLFGRSLATFDWNRDGKTDFVVSNIDTPVIVGTNQSSTAGHWFDLRLHARASSRDAIGAVVDVYIGSTLMRRQMTAGDGYQVTNQRALHFGLGESMTIDRLVVKWPSGTTSEYEKIIVDSEYDLIEGSPSFVRHRRESAMEPIIR